MASTWKEHGPLTIRTERERDEIHLVELYGELGPGGVEILASELRRVEASGPGEIIIDLSALNRIDPTGIRILHDTRARCREQARRLRFLRGGTQVERALAHAELESLEYAD